MSNGWQEENTKYYNQRQKQGEGGQTPRDKLGTEKGRVYAVTIVSFRIPVQKIQGYLTYQHLLSKMP